MAYELRPITEQTDCVNLFKLTCGDWSGDGHEKTDEFMVLTNKTADQLEHVHKLFFIDVLMKQCSDYEESQLSPETVQAFLDAGIVTEVDLSAGLTPEDYVTLFLDLIKYYIPSFSYTMLEVPYGNRIKVGGYGLY